MFDVTKDPRVSDAAITMKASNILDATPNGCMDQTALEKEIKDQYKKELKGVANFRKLMQHVIGRFTHIFADNDNNKAFDIRDGKVCLTASQRASVHEASLSVPGKPLKKDHLIEVIVKDTELDDNVVEKVLTSLIHRIAFAVSPVGPDKFSLSNLISVKVIRKEDGKQLEEPKVDIKALKRLRDMAAGK